jgi:hypothetical protein
MGDVIDIFTRLKQDDSLPRDQEVSTTLSTAEVAALNDFVEWVHAHGIPTATRESAIRALLLDGIEVFAEMRKSGEV